MAYRVLMQVVVTGSQVVGKAFMEAYRQASSASVQATANAAARDRAGGLSLSEARKILGLEGNQIELSQAQKKYDYLFDANSPQKSGSFYLQSKVYRAMERVRYELEPTKPDATAATKPNTGKGNATSPGNDAGQN